MKRYLVFFGEIFESSGGMDDLLGHYNSYDEALNSIDEKNKTYKGTSCWASIWDIIEGVEVYKVYFEYK